MVRQLMPSRTIVLLLFLLVVLLWYFWCYLFPKQLNNADIVLMKKVHYENSSGYIYIGVKNICKGRPSQYKDFLPKVAAQIADTTREEITIYFIMYDEETAFNVRYWPPYELEEEVPNSLLLKEYWECGKKPEFTYWYIPTLKHLNTEVPDFPIPLEDVQIEHAK